jgi:hypothetical protein
MPKESLLNKRHFQIDQSAVAAITMVILPVPLGPLNIPVRQCAVRGPHSAHIWGR